MARTKNPDLGDARKSGESRLSDDHVVSEKNGYSVTFHPAFASRCTIRGEGRVYEVFRPAAPHRRRGPALPEKHRVQLKGGRYNRDVTLEIEDPHHAIEQIHVELRTEGDSSGNESLELRPAAPQDIAADSWIQRAYYLLARRGFPSDSALADALGVHRSQVSRWSQGKPAQRENAWLLRDTATLIARLADHYESSTIGKWLFSDNPELGGEIPIDLLRHGRLPEVLMAIEAQTSGAFA